MTRIVEGHRYADDFFPDHDTTPKDLYGFEIQVGYSILFPVKQGGKGNAAVIRYGTVEHIQEPTHRGYGYWTRRIKVRAFDTGKVWTVDYPGNCILRSSI
jgi:hypothetical protein